MRDVMSLEVEKFPAVGNRALRPVKSEHSFGYTIELKIEGLGGPSYGN